MKTQSCLSHLNWLSTLVSDNPSKSDIDYIANAWRESNGNLDKIHSAVIERAISSTAPKFQWPMTWLFQVVRLSDASFFKGWDQIEKYDQGLMEVRKIFEELGQSFWHTRQPNGYSSAKSEWLSGEMFERRIRFSMQFILLDIRVSLRKNLWTESVLMKLLENSLTALLEEKSSLLL